VIQLPAEKLLTSEKIYEGKILNVRRDTVLIDGPGSSITTVREVVEHGSAVTIIAVNDGDEILMVSQYRWAIGQTMLEAPAGRVESTETPYEAAFRELREETGYGAGALQYLGAIWIAPGYSTEHMFVYRANGLYPDYLPADADEDISVVAVPRNQLTTFVRDGFIVDAKTIAALLMADLVADRSIA